MSLKMLSMRSAWIVSLARRPPSLMIIILTVLSTQVNCSNEQDVQCIMNMNNVLTCTWNSKENLNDNHTLYYWYGSTVSKVEQCPQYMVANNTNIGCKINISESPYRKFTVMLNSSSQSPPTVKVLLKLQDYVKMDPPFNLITESTSNLELQLKWTQAFGIIPEHCVGYEVKHQNKASDEWTMKQTSSTFFSIPSFDLCQNYTFHVRSQIKITCANSVTWSEWSEGVTWARNNTFCEEQPSAKMHPGITILMTLLLLLVIFFTVIRQERIWIILVPQIPNPGKKFEDLFSTYSGNFQAWLGVSKEIVENMKLSYTEPLCTVSEDPECPGPDEKSLVSISPANEQ